MARVTDQRAGSFSVQKIHIPVKDSMRQIMPDTSRHIGQCGKNYQQLHLKNTRNGEENYVKEYWAARFEQQSKRAIRLTGQQQ